MTKVSELEGVELDHWVAQAYSTACPNLRAAVTPFKPSTDWTYGGPIIERERIRLHSRVVIPELEGQMPLWAAQMFPDQHQLMPVYGYGDSPLIAAMRAFVTSKFGDDLQATRQQQEGGGQ